MPTMTDFIRSSPCKISCTSTLIPVRPDGNDRDFSPGSRHYSVLLRRTRPTRRFQLFFSKGPALSIGVELHEVLEALQMDAHSILSSDSFDSWAAELGFNPDSRKAFNCYMSTQSNTTKLQRFMGAEWQGFLAATEQED